jgi:predicted dehydrogenase
MTTTSTASPLRLALIGAGAMGANYVRAVQTTPDVQITAIIDNHVDRANEIGAVIGARAARSLDHAGEIDAVLVVVPTAAHRRVGEPLLRRGVPCLVEKPLALTEVDCRALIAAAAAGKTVLQVGHIERFNAAMVALQAQELAGAAIAKLTARRMNAGSARVTDIDVVMDLMVHDIDAVLAVKREPVTGVAATGDKDHAVARLTFADGAHAEITASRVTPGRTRDLSVVMTDGRIYALDYIERALTLDGAALPVTADANALGRQMSAFAHSIRRGRAPQVSGAEALDVMTVAWRVQEALGLPVGSPKDAS